MNAIDLLKQDHDAVDALFAKCESTPPSRHQSTMKQIRGELETHAHIEEKIFYPACRKKGDKELQDLVAEALEEHAQMKKFVREMNRANTSTEKREAKLKVLIEDTRHHVKEEEGEMFDMVESQFSSEELEALGEKMEAEKRRYMKAKGIRPSRQPQKGIVSTMLDKAMEAVGLSSNDRNGESRQKSANGRSKDNGVSHSTGAGAKKSSKARSATENASSGDGKPRASGAKKSTRTSKGHASSDGAKGRRARSSASR